MKFNLKMNKKYIAIGMVAIVFIIISIGMYGEFKGKILKKEYMEDIYVKTNEEKNNEVIATKKTITVEIKGEVKKPDVYELEEGSIVKDLINIAGGTTENAYIDNINRAKKLQNHELITILNKSDIDKESTGNTMGTNTSSASSKININTATIEELQNLDGIGESKAKSIVEYRDKNGMFQGIEDIKNVTGIGEKTFEKFQDKIEI